MTDMVFSEDEAAVDPDCPWHGFDPLTVYLPEFTAVDCTCPTMEQPRYHGPDCDCTANLLGDYCEFMFEVAGIAPDDVDRELARLGLVRQDDPTFEGSFAPRVPDLDANGDSRVDHDRAINAALGLEEPWVVARGSVNDAREAYEALPASPVIDPPYGGWVSRAITNTLPVFSRHSGAYAYDGPSNTAGGHEHWDD